MTALRDQAGRLTWSLWLSEAAKQRRTSKSIFILASPQAVEVHRFLHPDSHALGSVLQTSQLLQSSPPVWKKQVDGDRPAESEG